MLSGPSAVHTVHAISSGDIEPQNQNQNQIQKHPQSRKTVIEQSNLPLGKKLYGYIDEGYY